MKKQIYSLWAEESGLFIKIMKDEEKNQFFLIFVKEGARKKPQIEVEVPCDSAYMLENINTLTQRGNSCILEGGVIVTLLEGDKMQFSFEEVSVCWTLFGYRVNQLKDFFSTL